MGSHLYSPRLEGGGHATSGRAYATKRLALLAYKKGRYSASATDLQKGLYTTTYVQTWEIKTRNNFRFTAYKHLANQILFFSLAVCRTTQATQC